MLVAFYIIHPILEYLQNFSFTPASLRQLSFDYKEIKVNFFSIRRRAAEDCVGFAKERQDVRKKTGKGMQ